MTNRGDIIPLSIRRYLALKPNVGQIRPNLNLQAISMVNNTEIITLQKTSELKTEQPPTTKNTTYSH